MARRISWIFTDWVGTLANVGDTLIPQLERFGKRCRITADWPHVMEAWGIGHRALLDDIVAGREPWQPQSQIFVAAFSAVLRDIGIDINSLPQVALHDLGRFLLELKPWPDSREGVAMLRLVRPTGLYSLGPLEVMQIQTAEADIAFDHLVSAEPSRSLPPEPEGFAAAAAEVDIDPAEAVFLSTHPPMLRGAYRAGMQVVHIDRPIGAARVVQFEPTRDLEPLGRFRDVPRAAEWLAANLHK